MVGSQQNPGMNHVAASLQEHCLVINITNHKSLFLRKMGEKKRIEPGRENVCRIIFGKYERKQKQGHILCVCECERW